MQALVFSPGDHTASERSLVLLPPGICPYAIIVNRSARAMGGSFSGGGPVQTGVDVKVRIFDAPRPRGHVRPHFPARPAKGAGPIVAVWLNRVCGTVGGCGSVHVYGWNLLRLAIAAGGGLPKFCSLRESLRGPAGLDARSSPFDASGRSARGANPQGLHPSLRAFQFWSAMPFASLSARRSFV